MSTRFVLATARELRTDSSSPEGKNPKARKAVSRTVVSNMTLNNPEMLKSFPEISHCMRSPDPETKRMCFSYLETYIKSKPQHVGESLSQSAREVANPDSPPAIRGVASRTSSSIPIKTFAQRSLDLIPDALRSQDIYSRKTACFAVAKAWVSVPADVENSGLLGRLNQMLVKETSPIVIAAAVQSLSSITDSTPRLQFVVDAKVAQRLASFLTECPEFAQVSLLSALMRFVPQKGEEADRSIQIVSPCLRHANTAVTMGSARVLSMLSHYASQQNTESVPEQVVQRSSPQSNRPPEIEYAVLRNFYLLLQSIDTRALHNAHISPRTFFFRASDSPFIRATKIDILIQLCTAKTAETIVSESGEFIRLKSDITSRKRAISALGKLGTLYENAVRSCLTKLSAVVSEEPEAVTALVNIARRYPTNTSLMQFVMQQVIKSPPPKDNEARCAYFWIWATYSEQATTPLLTTFASALDNFSAEVSSVQSIVSSGCVKLFLKFPEQVQTAKLVPRVFEIATQSTLDPDVRDRAFIYLRLSNACPPQRAATIVAQQLPPIAALSSSLDSNQLEDLELSLGYISSLYLKPGEQSFRQASTRQLAASPALRPRSHNSAAIDASSRSNSITAPTSTSSIGGPLPSLAESPAEPNFPPMSGRSGRAMSGGSGRSTISPMGSGTMNFPRPLVSSPTTNSIGSIGPASPGYLSASSTGQSPITTQFFPDAQHTPVPLQGMQARQPQPQSSLYQNTTESGSSLDSYVTPKPPAPRPLISRESTSIDQLHNLSLEATPTGDQSVRLIDI